MNLSDDHEQKVANKVEEIHELELEALRRAGVAKEKEQGLEIESTEALRLFREATGYILRIRELREDIDEMLYKPDFFHTKRILGFLDDYNRTLEDIKSNPSFENSVEGFEPIEYEWNTRKMKVSIEEQTIQFTGAVRGTSRYRISLDGSAVETALLPRLIRLTKELENSLIGRCTSGKRPN